MNQNVSQNPYFDPNPRWYSTILQVLCAISAVLVAQANYLILRHTPTQVAKEYRSLLMGHIVM